MSAFLARKGSSAAPPDDAPVVEVDLASQWRGESAYVMSLHKAGSTLLNAMVQRLAEANGAAYAPLPNLLRRAGHSPVDGVRASEEVFAATGVVYAGFRAFPDYAASAMARAPKILLIRNPADMLTSHYFSLTVSHNAPGEGEFKQRFETARQRARKASMEEVVTGRIGWLKGGVARYAEALPRDRLAVYAYEDVIFEKPWWLEDMAGWLGLELTPQTRRAILSEVDILPDREDGGAHVRQVRPGDAQRKLSAEALRALDEAFDGIYDALLPYTRTPAPQS